MLMSALLLLALPEITRGSLLALSSKGLLFSLIPQTRDGDGLPAPDPRHRQTEQGGSRGDLQVSAGRVLPRAPDSMAWLVASGPICPLLPHPEETKVPQSPQPWGTLQPLQQPP